MKNEKDKKFKYFSMFTGIGGFELGIGEKGRCIGCSEIDKDATRLLSERFPSIKNWGDCTKIRPEDLPDFDMLCGGFPCQAFSIAGKRRGFEDTRGTMFFEVARILEVKRPKIVLLENVKGLLNHNKGETFSVILEALDELGYETQWMVLNSKFFGVPQSRERVFIVGNIRGECRPEILPFRKSNKKSNQSSQRIKKISSTRHCLQSPIRQAKFTRRNPWLYTALNESNGDNVKIRRMTPEECERLQSFPEGWTKGFANATRYKMLGNAVTVNVIKSIMKTLSSKHLNTTTTSN